MKNMKKILAMLLAMAMTVGMLSGCGGKEEAAEETPAATEEAAEETPAEEGGTLTLFLQANDDVRISIMDDYIVKNFEAAFPGWELEVSTIDTSDNGVAAMKTYNATGDLPDVYWSDTRWCQPMISSGNQLDMTEYITTDGFADKYDGNIGLMQFKGGVYALQPGSDATYYPVVFYDKEVFEANGCEVPTTLDELYAVCDKLVAAGIQPFSLEGTGWEFEYSWIQNIVMALDPAKADALINNEIDYSDPVILEALEILDTMLEKGYFGERSAAAAVQPADAREAFLGGKTAMRFDYYWQWSLYDDGTTDAFAFPTGNIGQMWGTTLGGYAVYSGSEHIDMAVKLAEYCCEQEAIYHNEHGTSTAFNTGIEVKAGSDLQQKLNDMYANFADKKITIPSNTMDAAVLAELKTILSGFIAGQYTPQEVVDEFNPIFEENTYFD